MASLAVLAVLALQGPPRSAAGEGPANLALTARVTASSTFKPVYSPDKAIDSELSNESRWISAKTNGPHYLTVDLGLPRRAGALHLVTGWKVDAGWTNPVKSFVFQSWDGENWADIHGTRTANNRRCVLAFEFPGGIEVTGIRLKAYDNTHVRVVELRIYAFSRKGYPMPPALDTPADRTPAQEYPAIERGTICISGIYPHLATFNRLGECGIGAVVPWAGRLWVITYPPHMTRGSSDKLYEIDEHMTRLTRPESVGGTHACRMIHRESDQLVIGPYFIDAKGNVRAADLNVLVGRMTAVARHLTDPANRVYFFDMEGAIYEVNVHTLEVSRLFEKPVPGWHGKGGYTGQGRLVITNNGEQQAGGHSYKGLLVGGPAKSEDEAGVLAEWDGRTWRIVERKQFTDVTGPGGIYGSPPDAPGETSPVWSIGWDRRSVILKLLDGGQWHTFLLPKASHCFDARHGWYTEWPRIREIEPRRLMMVMHGAMYDFPVGFSSAETGGIRPIATHLRYIPDFCHWNGRLVLASDDTSIMKNRPAGQSQSNMWFGKAADLKGNGRPAGWGGPWVRDAVRAGEPSAPFLIAGFDRRVLHLTHSAGRDVAFTLEIDCDGRGQWREYRNVAVPAGGYRYHVFPDDFRAEWIRVKTDHDCTATAYFHYSPATGHDGREAGALFGSIPGARDRRSWTAGIIRPAGHNRGLQFLARTVDGNGRLGDAVYWEVDKRMKFRRIDTGGRAEEVTRLAGITKDFEVDAASVVMTQGGKRYRLPRGDSVYDEPFASGWPRGIRECVSERYLVNVHGTLYEMPRENGLPRIKPVCSHGRKIADFCTWRGLLVIAGNLAEARPDGQFFCADEQSLPAGGQGLADAGPGLWFGSIDDLWKLGKPVGRGGPWAGTEVRAGVASDPYLMTGYDRKRVELSHDGAGDVEFTIEVDFDHVEWKTYRTVGVPAGRTVTHVFPEGFSAHWVRTRASKPCRTTAQFIYE